MCLPSLCLRRAPIGPEAFESIRHRWHRQLRLLSAGGRSVVGDVAGGGWRSRSRNRDDLFKDNLNVIIRVILIVVGWKRGYSEGEKIMNFMQIMAVTYR